MTEDSSVINDLSGFEGLSEEDKIFVDDIIHKRTIEARREQIAKRKEMIIADIKEGKSFSGNADEIIAHLDSQMD